MSAPEKIQVNWEAHVEALPLATWITQTRLRSSGTPECGPVFLNQACRELLGLSSQDSPPAAPWLRHVHTEDRESVLIAWTEFLEGKTPRFFRTVRWIRPDTRETVSLAVRAQKLLCGDIQGWLRPTTVEQALSRLEELCDARR